jgi:hypothetical protein
MLKDVRTWTTLAYLLVMLPLGIVYFTLAVCGLAVSVACIGTPLALLARQFGWTQFDFTVNDEVFGGAWSLTHPLIGSLLLLVTGVIILTVLMHLARALIRGHARLAKSLLVVPGA